MTTRIQDKEFADELDQHIRIETSALKTAIEYIGNEFDPDDVFSDKKLLSWAQGKLPSDLFDDKELIDWAESNGYEKA